MYKTSHNGVMYGGRLPLIYYCHTEETVLVNRSNMVLLVMSLEF